jgi:hypothetical protein
MEVLIKTCSWEFLDMYYIKKQYMWQASQKLIRLVGGKNFSKRIRCAVPLLEG